MPYKEKEKRKAYMKKWWNEHKEEVNEKRRDIERERYYKNREKILNKSKIYYTEKKLKKEKSRQFLRKFLENKKVNIK